MVNKLINLRSSAANQKHLKLLRSSLNEGLILILKTFNYIYIYIYSVYVYIYSVYIYIEGISRHFRPKRLTISMFVTRETRHHRRRSKRDTETTVNQNSS